VFGGVTVQEEAVYSRVYRGGVRVRFFIVTLPGKVLGIGVTMPVDIYEAQRCQELGD
jgi:hypothetical protein